MTMTYLAGDQALDIALRSYLVNMFLGLLVAICLIWVWNWIARAKEDLDSLKVIALTGDFMKTGGHQKNIEQYMKQCPRGRRTELRKCLETIVNIQSGMNASIVFKKITPMVNENIINQINETK